MGFAFPKEERWALVASEPEKFMLPGRSDLRYNWVLVRLAAIDVYGDARARRRRVADGRAQAGRRRLRGPIEFCGRAGSNVSRPNPSETGGERCR